MGVNVSLKQNLNFTHTRFIGEANPIVLKNQRTTAGIPALKALSDVEMDNAINNSVLIYNQSDEKFHLDQLSLDGGDF
jgi:hypothetical protein